MSSIQAIELKQPPVRVQKENFYQAIGWLHGEVSLVENRLQIKINNEFVFPLQAKKKIFNPLKKSLDFPKILWIRCYPGFSFKSQMLYFEVVCFSIERPDSAQANRFILRGLWQFIPQQRRPVFSVYRNCQSYEGERIKNKHLPLIWKEQMPFKFSKTSSVRPKFYQIEVRFLPQLNCFGWIKNLAQADENLPKKVKPK